MKLVFGAAAEDIGKTYKNRITHTLKGTGPWLCAGKICDTPDAWLTQARRTISALGVFEALCAILPSNASDEHRFAFTFNSHKDYRLSNIAVFGETSGEIKWSIHCNTPEERQQKTAQIVKFLQENEIAADITNDGECALQVLTRNSFDHFLLIEAYEQGRFSAKPKGPNAALGPQIK